ncbi:hypothetical protein RZO55_16585 [Clostridium boliviensis]|uniref:RsgI N-terminal anti-sigma domain-containing protein n=1 Tax=Clostridium boliviensis TaxID=318465 RepID=A0ABU4GQC7_9CLOT|nr:hypothetical protein [Clostridium boliviensis]MDW2799192.1 hypothetical protein [Clostridium boliviensis]
MKSVVLEIKGKYAAVLSDDGSIKKVKNKNYGVGQEIWSIQKKGDFIMKKLSVTKKMALCASCAAIMLFSAGVWAYAAPYSYVSLDVNPSIEYTLNRLERVIKVNAVNDDGQAILAELNMADLKNKSIEDAISVTVQQISNEGYFKENNLIPMTATASEALKAGEETAEPVRATASQATENNGTDSQWEKTIDGGIVITVSGGNSKVSDKVVSEIREAVKKVVAGSVEVEVSSVGLARVQEARTLGVTPGKLNLVEKLKSSASEPDKIVIEEWLNRPVKDIMKEIKKNRKTAVAKQPETTSGTASPSDAVSNTVSEETSSAVKSLEGNGKAADVSGKMKPSERIKPDKAEKAPQEKETEKQLKEEIKINQESVKQEKAELKEQSKEIKESERVQSKEEKQGSKTDSDKSSDDIKEKKETPVKKSNQGNSKKGS